MRAAVAPQWIGPEGSVQSGWSLVLVAAARTSMGASLDAPQLATAPRTQPAYYAASYAGCEIGGAGGQSARRLPTYYLMIFVTRPAPTVRPPSRIANLRPSSIAIGWISLTVIVVLSPGMTISVPSWSVTTPVTSVVRK